MMMLKLQWKGKRLETKEGIVKERCMEIYKKGRKRENLKKRQMNNLEGRFIRMYV